MLSMGPTNTIVCTMLSVSTDSMLKELEVHTMPSQRSLIIGLYHAFIGPYWLHTMLSEGQGPTMLSWRTLPYFQRVLPCSQKVLSCSRGATKQTPNMFPRVLPCSQRVLLSCFQGSLIMISESPTMLSELEVSTMLSECPTILSKWPGTQ